MSVLRVGVVGGGLVAQAVHLPLLAAMPDRFTIAGIADPQDSVRLALAQRYGATPYPNWQDMLAEAKLDAVIVCAPNALHYDIVADAINFGVHCLVEKPLCIDPGDAEELRRLAAEAKIILHVGYMKRFDAAYNRLLDDLRRQTAPLRYINATTYDPGLGQFFPDGAIVSGGPIAKADRDDLLAIEADQVSRAIGVTDAIDTRCFVDVYLGALVHDVNAIHGVIDACGLGRSNVLASRWWNDGRAATISAQLDDGLTWNSTWLLTPHTARFVEEITFVFDDCTRRLEFEPPYGTIKLRGTQYTVTSAAGTTVREFADTAFRDELHAFHIAIENQKPITALIDSGCEDITLLAEGFKRSR